MTLDIIIPTANEFQNVARLIPYLQQHIEPSTKIIIVDADTSNDELSQICNDSNVLYIKSKFTNRAVQMNQGADRSEADILLFLHADVVPPKEFVLEIKSAIEQGYEAGIFAYDFKSDKLLLKINSWFTRFQHLFAGGGDQGQFYLRNIFNQLGQYDSHALIMEDFYLYHKMKSSEVKHTIIQNPLKVSARKFEQNNWLKVNAVSLFVFIMYWCGAEPQNLKKVYNQLLK